MNQETNSYNSQPHPTPLPKKSGALPKGTSPPPPTYCIKLGEKLLGFVFHILGVGFDVHHGVEVLRPLQGGFRSVPAQGTPRDEELSSRILSGNLKRGEKAGKNESRHEGNTPHPAQGELTGKREAVPSLQENSWRGGLKKKSQIPGYFALN